MLRLEDVRAFYGPIEALKGVSLAVEAGEIVALIGANGAGKSTTLMTVSGVIPPRTGRIFFGGIEIHCLPPHQVAQMGVAQVPEGRRIFPGLTTEENLLLGAFHRRDRQAVLEDLERAYENFGILRQRRYQPGGTLSGGEQQILAIGRALMGRPRLLLLDEPSLGLAPRMAETIFEMIRRINREGKTILLVEQNARAALDLARRAYVMETGRIALEGTARSLREDPRVRATYLGEN